MEFSKVFQISGDKTKAKIKKLFHWLGLTQYYRKIISIALNSAVISLKEFTLVSYETENYRRVKVNIRMKDNQQGNI